MNFMHIFPKLNLETIRENPDKIPRIRVPVFIKHKAGSINCGANHILSFPASPPIFFQIGN